DPRPDPSARPLRRRGARPAPGAARAAGAARTRSPGGAAGRAAARPLRGPRVQRVGAGGAG
ncbi:MAG: hypothetical protein AVDCRST_MAG66-1003, partial [uncultured Pseudonocardia sp.]